MSQRRDREQEKLDREQERLDREQEMLGNESGKRRRAGEAGQIAGDVGY